MKIKDKRLFELLKEYLTVYLPFQRIVSPLTVKSYKETLNLYMDFLCFYNGFHLPPVSGERPLQFHLFPQEKATTYARSSCYRENI